MEFYAIYQMALLCVCFSSLAGIALVAFAIMFSRVSSVLAQKGKRAIPFVLFALIATIWAGTKPAAPVWRFQNGVADNGSQYDVAECVAVARWTASPVYQSYNFKWSYRAKGNDIWIALPDAKVSDGETRAIIPVEPGTIVDFMCWAEYVAPIQVVTNGVYHLNGVMRSADTVGSDRPNYVTPGIRIMADGEIVLTPTNRPPAAMHSIYDINERKIEE